MTLEKFEQEATEKMVELAKTQKRILEDLREADKSLKDLQLLMDNIEEYAKSLSSEERKAKHSQAEEIANRINDITIKIISEEERKELGELTYLLTELY